MFQYQVLSFLEFLCIFKIDENDENEYVTRENVTPALEDSYNTENWERHWYRV